MHQSSGNGVSTGEGRCVCKVPVVIQGRHEDEAAQKKYRQKGMPKGQKYEWPLSQTGIEPDVGVEPTTLRFLEMLLKSLTLYRLS